VKLHHYCTDCSVWSAGIKGRVICLCKSDSFHHHSKKKTTKNKISNSEAPLESHWNGNLCCSDIL